MLAHFLGIPLVNDVFEIGYLDGAGFGVLFLLLISYGVLVLAALLFDAMVLRGKFRLGWTAEAHSLASRAQAGDINAQYLLGRSFLEGKLGIECNEDDGIDWLDRAAEHGHQTAALKLDELSNNQSYSNVSR